MFSRTKLTYAGLMLGLLTAFGAVAQAQQPATQNPTEGTERREGRGFRRGPGGGGAFGPGVLRELNLTDEQKQQVHTIIQQSFASSKGAREELRQLGEKKRQGTLTSDEETRARTLHEQMRAAMKETQTKIAGLLTAEQKATAANLIKERKGNHERFGDRRRGPRGQGDGPAQRPSNP
ncbi:MAG: motif family protein [Blastocatellia bacterium]|jgi:Spy/CpxP family protein refolding chaperone|nr:motif family protein [Blastocatellia bacterium]